MINLNNNEWHYDESNAKVVNKPWGREVWINFRKGEEVGDKEKRYIMKKLYINKSLILKLKLFLCSMPVTIVRHLQLYRNYAPA